MTKLLVEVYTKKDCSKCVLAVQKGCDLCKQARDTISKVSEDVPFEMREVDISVSEDLTRRYKEDIPIVFINGKKAFKFKVDETEFRKRVRREIIKAGIMRLWNKKEHYS